MRAPVLTPIPGMDVRTWERGWAHRKFLDSSGQWFALVKDGRQGGGEARDDQCCCVGARNGHALLVQGGEDVFDQPLGHSRRLRPQLSDQPPTDGLADLGR